MKASLVTGRDSLLSGLIVLFLIVVLLAVGNCISVGATLSAFEEAHLTHARPADHSFATSMRQAENLKPARATNAADSDKNDQNSPTWLYWMSTASASTGH
jgi:hypothetical protein